MLRRVRSKRVRRRTPAVQNRSDSWGSITNVGPSWRPQLPEPKVVELVRAGRIVLAHWEGGDLAAQIQRLSCALEEFVQLPDEG